MNTRNGPLSFRGLEYYIPAVVATLAVLIAVFLADMQKRQLEEEYLRSSMTEQLGQLRSRLEGNILGNIKLVQGLVATIETEPDMTPERFTSLASRIFDDDHQLRSLAIAPDFKVSLVYPLKGNEASIGLDYRKNERQRAAALQVEEQGRIIVTGPVELVQGGRAVIVRYPIYTGPDNAFFGIASAVIDLDKLLQSSGFSSNLDIAVSMSLLMTWHAEAAGSKIRYVPARIPDLLRTPEIIAFEADAAHQDARAQANETAFRLDYNRQPGTDMEVCMPQETLEAFAEGRGMWNGLARAVRAEQLQHMARLIRELYPSFRLFLYNEKEKFSVPYTIFGSQRAAIFVGGMYLVLNNADSIRKMQRHFDDLIRFTRVHAHESADYVGSLEVS